MPHKDPAAKRAYQRRYYAENIERIRELGRRHYASHKDERRNVDLKRLYGITVEQYNAILDAQGGVCFICKRGPGKRRLHVDHSHETGEVRGLLCTFDNHRLLSNLKTRTLLMRLRNAIEYLENPPARRLSIQPDDEAANPAS